MTTHVWAGGSSGSWDDAGNWIPSGGPPEPGGHGARLCADGHRWRRAAAELDTSNASGQVTLDGAFNVGTIFNGAEMTLAGNITSEVLETFVNLDITGDVSVVGDTDATYEGIFQDNGTVDIDNGGSVAASYYLLSYNGGSLDQPNVNAFTLDGTNGGAWLDIVSMPTVNDTDQIVGGFAVTTSASVGGAERRDPHHALSQPERSQRHHDGVERGHRCSVARESG